MKRKSVLLIATKLDFSSIFPYQGCEKSLTKTIARKSKLNHLQHIFLAYTLYRFYLRCFIVYFVLEGSVSQI